MVIELLIGKFFLENFTSSSLVASDFILPPEKISSSALVGHFDPAYATGSGFAGIAASDCSDLSSTYTDLTGVSVMVLWRTLAHVTVVIMPGRVLEANTDPYRLELEEQHKFKGQRFLTISSDFSTGYSFWMVGSGPTHRTHERIFKFGVDGLRQIDCWPKRFLTRRELVYKKYFDFNQSQGHLDRFRIFGTHVAYTQTGTTGKAYINGKDVYSGYPMTESIAPEAIRTTFLVTTKPGNRCP